LSRAAFVSRRICLAAFVSRRKCLETHLSVAASVAPHLSAPRMSGNRTFGDVCSQKVGTIKNAYSNN
jgi:hypothetical protein